MQTAHNRTVYASPLKRLGLRKTPVGASAFVVFFSATIFSPGLATQALIRAKNRRKQPER
jgi:hypothetical protein